MFKNKKIETCYGYNLVNWGLCFLLLFCAHEHVGLCIYVWVCVTPLESAVWAQWSGPGAASPTKRPSLNTPSQIGGGAWPTHYHAQGIDHRASLDASDIPPCDFNNQALVIMSSSYVCYPCVCVCRRMTETDFTYEAELTLVLNFIFLYFCKMEKMIKTYSLKDLSSKIGQCVFLLLFFYVITVKGPMWRMKWHLVARSQIATNRMNTAYSSFYTRAGDLRWPLGNLKT